MQSKKRKRLDLVVKAIQRRFGPAALQRGEQVYPQPTLVTSIPTGFADLDAALDGIGGIPRGRLTEILSAQTAGAATLALKIIAKAQAGGSMATYVDLGTTFDPDYASRCGVQLSRSRLLLVNPDTAANALQIAQALIANRGTGVLVFDLAASLQVTAKEARGLDAILSQLIQPLANSDCALIFLTPLEAGHYPGGLAALPHYATLRILLRKERWLLRGRDIRGYQSRAVVLKNQLGRAGLGASIAITFNGTVAGDGT